MAAYLAILFLLAIKSQNGAEIQTLCHKMKRGDFMGKLDVNKVAFWVTTLFILVAPIENVLRTEQIVYILGIVALIFCVVNRRLLHVDNSKYILLLMAYIFLTCYWSAEENAFSSLVVIYAELLFLFLQLQFSYSESEYQRIKIAFLVQNWILLFLCLTNGSYMDSRFWLKSATSGADPNYLSGWFVIPLCFAVEFLFAENVKKILKVVLIAQIVLSFYFIMQTASKSGLITNAFVVAIAIVYTSRKLIREHPGRALSIMALFLIAIVIAINHMPAYLVQRLTNGDMTGTGRFPMWLTLAKEMFNNPLKMLVGFGTGSVKYYTGKGLVSHNTFLDLLFNEGFLGFSFLGCYIVKSIKIKRSKCPFTVIAFSGMSVLLLTLSAFNARFFMLVLFLIGMNVTEQPMTDENKAQ